MPVFRARLTNLGDRGTGGKDVGLCGPHVTVTVAPFCCRGVKAAQTVHMSVSVAMFQYNFIFGH